MKLTVHHSLVACVTIFASLAALITAAAGGVQIPQNVVNTYAYITDTSSPYQNHTGYSSGYKYSQSLPVSASRYTNYSGQVPGDYGYINTGDFHTSGFATVGADGKLSAYTEISGTIGSNCFVTADSVASYYDDLTVLGPTLPATVVFHLSLHGTATGVLGGPGWIDNLSGVNGLGVLAGALDLTIWNYDPSSGAVTGGRGYGRLPSDGNGAITNMDIAVGWPETGNDLIFELSLVAFGRVVTYDTVPVTEISDFSQTAKLQGVTLLDSQGKDITSSTSFTFARAIPAPPPVSLLSAQVVGGNFSFQFMTVSNLGYAVQANSDLSATNWTALTNIIGNGLLYQFSEPLAVTGQRYYRVASGQ